MRQLKTILTVIGAVTVLVLAGNTVSLAATGHSFILGKANTANKTTSLSRTTSGTVLNLNSKSSSNAPLSVNGKGKVANLNADMVDGVDSSTMLNKSWTYTVPVESAVSSFEIHFPGLPTGKYLATFAYAASMSAVTSLNCGFRQDGNYKGIAYGGNGGGFSSSAGSGVYDSVGHPISFGCFDWTGTFTSSGANLVTFTQVNSVTNSGTASARVAPKVRAGSAN